jgi:hypothetical protein
MQYQCKTSHAAPSFLARQAGLMCENARECKEMQEFSRVLQQLFDKRHQWNILAILFGTPLASFTES